MGPRKFGRAVTNILPPPEHKINLGGETNGGAPPPTPANTKYRTKMKKKRDGAPVSSKVALQLSNFFLQGNRAETGCSAERSPQNQEL